MIWQATFGSGWRIGTRRPFTRTRRLRIRLAQVLVNIACCGAAHGATTSVTTCALPTAAGSARRIPTAASVFVAPAHFPSSEVLNSEERPKTPIPAFPHSEEHAFSNLNHLVGNKHYATRNTQYHAITVPSIFNNHSSALTPGPFAKHPFGAPKKRERGVLTYSSTADSNTSVTQVFRLLSSNFALIKALR